MQTFALYSITEMTSEPKVYYHLPYFCNMKKKLRKYSLDAHLELNYL